MKSKRVGPQNKDVRDVVIKLRKTQKPVYKRVAESLVRPRRKRFAVQLDKIMRLAREGESLICLGKVVGTSSRNKKVMVYAINFSEKSARAIKAAGGDAVKLSLLELEELKKIKGLRLIK